MFPKSRGVAFETRVYLSESNSYKVLVPTALFEEINNYKSVGELTLKKYVIELLWAFSNIGSVKEKPANCTGTSVVASRKLTFNKAGKIEILVG